MNVKALFLDVGWTLLYPRNSIWTIFAELAGEAGVDIGAIQIEDLVHGLLAGARPRAVSEFEAGTAYTDSDAEFAAQFAMLGRLVFGMATVPGDHGELSHDFFDRFWNPDNWVVFPDVLPCLRRLRAAGVRVGVLSNAASSLDDTLSHLGLTQWLDWLVISAVEGTKKPDRRIFERALAYAGVSAAEAVHVGDMYIEDILGARAVGVRPLLMDRGVHAMFPHHPVSADHPTDGVEVVHNLDEVAAAIAVPA